MGYGSPAWAELIAQIRRDPSVEELWYVAADYLLEHEDPRGEYIILCGKLERGMTSGYVAAYERRRELANTQPWRAAMTAAGFPDNAPPSWSTSSRVAAAFVERLELDHETIGQLPKLCRYEPITQLGCRGIDRALPEIRAIEELREIYELEIDSDSWTLLASPNLVNVHRLRTIGRATAKQVGILATSVLRPHYITIGSDIAPFETLAGTPVLDELRKLPADTDACVDALGDHPLPRLRELDTQRLSAGSLARLARNFDQLEVARLTTAAFPLVIANARSGRLRELFLHDPNADVALTNALIDSPACLHVASLSMRGVEFPAVEAAIRRLAYHGYLRELQIDNYAGTGSVQIPGVLVIEAR